MATGGGNLPRCQPATCKGTEVENPDFAMIKMLPPPLIKNCSYYSKCYSVNHEIKKMLLYFELCVNFGLNPNYFDKKCMGTLSGAPVGQVIFDKCQNLQSNTQ